MRFLTHHWPKLSIMVVFYALVAVSLSTLTNAQIDAMQSQADTLQFVDHTTSQ